MSHAGHVAEKWLFNASKQRSSLELNLWNQKMEKRISEGQEVNLQRAVHEHTRLADGRWPRTDQRASGEEEDDDSLASGLNRQRDPRSSYMN